MRQLDGILREFDPDSSFMYEKLSRMEGCLFLNGSRSRYYTLFIVLYTMSSQQFLAHITP